VKAAETQFRKARLAFEGPKHTGKRKGATKQSADDNQDGGDIVDLAKEEDNATDNKPAEKSVFVPTISKDEFVSISSGFK